MGKSRMMGAGLGSSSLYKTNPSVNTFGGSKKQGLPASVGLDSWADRASRILSVGTNRNKLFVMNQLGGVGVGRSMFNVKYTNKDGVRKNTVKNILFFKDLIYTSSPVLPTDYFFYGIDNNLNVPNTISFMFKNSNPCLTTDKNYVQFYNTTPLFPITVESNNNFIMTYDTFKNILGLSGLINEASIDQLIYGIKNNLIKFISTSGLIYC